MIRRARRKISSPRTENSRAVKTIKTSVSSTALICSAWASTPMPARMPMRSTSSSTSTIIPAWEPVDIKVPSSG